MSSQFLNQAEIDALLNRELPQEDASHKEEEALTIEEIDTLGEIANSSTFGEPVSGNLSKTKENPSIIVPGQPEDTIKEETWIEEPGNKLELILDIPLTVSVVLGKTRRPIQDILCFQSGSIVELNRLVNENVDILVNNMLVAKGEVVVINDNFGVKITNILNPKERMLQLKGAV